MNDQKSDIPASVTARPSFSALAVVAVVLAFIPLCPPINALGAVLGVIAWRRIRDSMGRLAGRRTSLTATFGGVFMSIVTLVGFQQLAEMMERQQGIEMGVALDGFLQAVEDERYDESLKWWSIRDQQIGHEELVEFGAGMRTDFGKLESVRIGKMTTVPGESLFAPQANCWIICRFDSGVRNGSARFVLQTSTGSWSLVPLLIELRIEGDDDSELVLPIGAVAPVGDSDGDTDTGDDA